MRRLARLGVAAISGLVLVAPLGAQEATQGAEQQAAPPPRGTPFVYVNTQAILPQVPGAQQAQERFNQELASFNSEVQALRAEIDSLLAQYRQQEAMLSADAREERQQAIVARQQAAQTRAAELEQHAGQRQQELLAPILDHLGNMIEEVRAENGYAIVFDVSATGVVAADPSLDISRLVLNRLAAAGGTAPSPGR